MLNSTSQSRDTHYMAFPFCTAPGSLYTLVLHTAKKYRTFPLIYILNPFSRFGACLLALPHQGSTSASCCSLHFASNSRAQELSLFLPCVSHLQKNLPSAPPFLCISFSLLPSPQFPDLPVCSSPTLPHFCGLQW